MTEVYGESLAGRTDIKVSLHITAVTFYSQVAKLTEHPSYNCFYQVKLCFAIR